MRKVLLALIMLPVSRSPGLPVSASAQGQLDTSFAGDGRVTSGRTSIERRSDLVFQPNGHIVVGGEEREPGEAQESWRLTRLTEDSPWRATASRVGWATSGWPA